MACIMFWYFVLPSLCMFLSRSRRYWVSVLIHISFPLSNQCGQHCFKRSLLGWFMMYRSLDLASLFLIRDDSISPFRKQFGVYCGAWSIVLKTLFSACCSCSRSLVATRRVMSSSCSLAWCSWSLEDLLLLHFLGTGWFCHFDKFQANVPSNKSAISLQLLISLSSIFLISPIVGFPFL